MVERDLSKTMADAMAAMMEAGSLERLPGGFWAAPGCPRHPHNGYPIVSWGASTIKALVARGVAQYANFKEGRKFRFPINVIPTQLTASPTPQPSAEAPAAPSPSIQGAAGVASVSPAGAGKGVAHG